MGQIIRSIPYKSQYDQDASEFRNDCGPACVAMILNGLGVNVTTNNVYWKTGAKHNGYVSVGQLIRAARTYDVAFEYFYPWSLNELKSAVKWGHAVIPLIHYGAWSKIGITQNSFRGPHFVVVLGYDEEYIYINDPLWSGSRRWEGEHKRLTYRQFEAAWSTASKDGNRNYSGIFCTVRLPVDEFGVGGEPTPIAPPAPAFEVDPFMKRRIEAWAAFFRIPLNELDSSAVVTAYSDAMGDWGLEVAVHTVGEKDTLPQLSLMYYGDPMRWDVLVYFNGMTMLDPIHDGDILLIPEPLDQPIVIPEQEIPEGGTPLHDKVEVETTVKPQRQ